MGQGIYLLKDGEVAVMQSSFKKTTRQTVILSALTGIWMYLAHIT